MKTSTVVIIGGALVALLYFGGLGQAANVLQYYISSVSFTSITNANIVLVVQNPSNAAILLNSMAGTISANGTAIGNISNFQGGVTIPANQQVGVTINVALSALGIASSVFAALMSPTGTNAINFVITGNANINGGLIVPFNITQTVTV